MRKIVQAAPGNIKSIEKVFKFNQVGARGPQGEQGDTGDTGPIGPQGPQGEPGTGINYDSPIAVNTSQTITPNDGDYFISTAKKIDLTGTAGEVFEPAESGETTRRIWGLGAGLSLIDVDIDTSSLVTGNQFAFGADNGESRILMLNAAGDIEKVGGVVIRSICRMRYDGAAINIANATVTKVDTIVTITDNTGQMADPITNKRIDIIRSGRYNVAGVLRYGSNVSSHTLDHETRTRVHLNGIFLAQEYGYIHAAQNLSYSTIVTKEANTFAAGDYLELAAFHSTVGGSESLPVKGPNDEEHQLYAEEVDPW